MAAYAFIIFRSLAVEFILANYPNIAALLQMLNCGLVSGDVGDSDSAAGSVPEGSKIWGHEHIAGRKQKVILRYFD